jgi:hypothetical protein
MTSRKSPGVVWRCAFSRYPFSGSGCRAATTPPAFSGRNERRGTHASAKPLRRCTRRYSPQRDEFYQAKQIPNATRIPRGFQPKAQGCRSAATLGNRAHDKWPTPTGLWLRAKPEEFCHNPVGLEWNIGGGRFPRVVASRQPWAGGHNPVGIERIAVRKLGNDNSALRPPLSRDLPIDCVKSSFHKFI